MKKTLCAECPINRRDEWRARGAVLKMEMSRHDLTFRELTLAELILDKTYGWNRQSVVFPQLRFFTEFTGIQEPDVVKVLKTLHARRVIRIITIKGRPTYSINGDTEAWKAMPRVSKETMQAINSLLREHNGEEPMNIDEEAALNFKNSPATRKVSAKMCDLPIGELTAGHTAEFPNLL